MGIGPVCLSDSEVAQHMPEENVFHSQAFLIYPISFQSQVYLDHCYRQKTRHLLYSQGKI